jgi:hypothetical protein
MSLSVLLYDNETWTIFSKESSEVQVAEKKLGDVTLSITLC